MIATHAVKLRAALDEEMKKLDAEEAAPPSLPPASRAGARATR